MSLLNAGSVLDAIDIKGKTPLFYAIKEEDENLIKLLVEHGSSLTVKCKSGLTPLQYAVKKECEDDIIKFLKIAEKKEKEQPT